MESVTEEVDGNKVLELDGGWYDDVVEEDEDEDEDEEDEEMDTVVADGRLLMVLQISIMVERCSSRGC